MTFHLHQHFLTHKRTLSWSLIISQSYVLLSLSPPSRIIFELYKLMR